MRRRDAQQFLRVQVRVQVTLFVHCAVVDGPPHFKIRPACNGAFDFQLISARVVPVAPTWLAFVSNHLAGICNLQRTPSAARA